MMFRNHFPDRVREAAEASHLAEARALPRTVSLVTRPGRLLATRSAASLLRFAGLVLALCMNVRVGAATALADVGLASPSPCYPAAVFAQLPSAPIGDVGKWVLCLFGVIGIIAGLLHAWNEGVKAFGKKPPMGEQMRNSAAALESKIEEVDRKRSVGIAGAHRAQQQHASEIRAEIIPRATLEKELLRLDSDQKAISLRVETVAGMVTDAKDEVLKAGNDRLAVMTKRLDQLDRHSATHEERSRNTQHALDSMSDKLDALIRDRGITTPKRS